jgi:hypothetical protein
MQLYINDMETLLISTNTPMGYYKNLKVYESNISDSFTLKIGGGGSINSVMQGSYRVLEMKGVINDNVFLIAGFLFCKNLDDVSLLSESQVKIYNEGVSLGKKYTTMYKSPYQNLLGDLRIKLKKIKTKSMIEQQNKLLEKDSNEKNIFYDERNKLRDKEFQKLLALL